MNNPNFVLLNNFMFENGKPTGFAGRHVAFPVANAKDGKTIFATCAHALVAAGDQYGFQFLYSDGTELPPMEPTTNYIVPEELGLDLAFMAIRTDRDLRPVKLSDKRPAKPQTLCHCRNVCHREGFPLDTSHVLTETTAANTGRKYSFFRGGFERTEDVEMVTGVKPPTTHIGLSMQSWPGVSGSPLWDKWGNVLGMVAGGNERLTQDNPEYFLCYLPAKKIQNAIKKFLKGSVV